MWADEKSHNYISLATFKLKWVHLIGLFMSKGYKNKIKKEGK